MPTKKKPKRIRFSGRSEKTSEEIHDIAERVARAVMTPVPKTTDKKEENVNA